MSSVAIAQQTDQDADTDGAEGVLEEVIVVAQGYRESLRSAIQTKQTSSQIVDAITAEEMGRFPAQNLAEAMQGVTGVAMTRDDGGGEFISIRGMSPEMTRIELNGRTVSLTAGSSNPGNATTLSFFSPDMISRVTVIKTPRAIDVEGGVGGTVKLETMKPLDLGEFRARVYGTYGDDTVKKDPETNLGAFVNMVLADGRVGLALGGTYTDKDRRIDQAESLDGWFPVDDDPALGYYPGRVRVQQRVGEQPRTNLNGTLQFAVSDEFMLTSEFVYAQEDRNDLQQRLEADYSRGNFISGGEISSNGTLLSGDFDRVRVTLNYLDRLRDIEQYGYSFKGDWSRDAWTVTGEAAFSHSNEDTLDARARARVNRMPVGYDASNRDFIAIIDAAGTTDLTDLATAADGYPSYNRVDWNLRTIGTEETAFNLDFERDLGGIFSTLYFGARYSSREVNRKQGQPDSDLIPGFQEPGWLPSLAEGNFFFDDYAQPLLPDWIRPDTGSMHQYDAEARSVTEYNPTDTWTITEDNTAFYVMTDFANDTADHPYFGNVGVRYVDYDYSGDGYQTDPSSPGDFIPYHPKDSASEVLPSANVRWDLKSGADSNLFLRAGAGRVLSRPDPQYISPIARLNDELDSVSVGNPGLDPYLAWQYDLAFERYFGDTGEGLMSAGVFYKDVENFFEEVTLTNQDLSPWGVPDTGNVTTYVSGGSATVKGFEVSFQTPFTWLDGKWQNFGVVANYTYVDSERTTDDGSKAPMPGTSKHSASFVFYYSGDKLDSRLIMNYRDDYLLEEVTQRYVKGEARLDFALRYNFTDKLVGSLDVANITEVTQYGYNDGIKDRLWRRQLEGRKTTVGLSYTF
ncbi:MAG: TonB-dependent receptor [Xanthomonadales bacterium]|nr:TonB-dependent receptor [Xanthomonadales bacterium]